MKVSELMTKNIACVEPTTTLVETAQLMQKHNVGSIPVCDQSGVVGIVTDRDIVVRNVAHATNPQTTSVRDVMSTEVSFVTPDTEINEVSRIMAEKKIRRLPVVENNKVIGIVSLGDISTDVRFDAEASAALTEISTPSKPEKIDPRQANSNQRRQG